MGQGIIVQAQITVYCGLQNDANFGLHLVTYLRETVLDFQRYNLDAVGSITDIRSLVRLENKEDKHHV